MPRWTLADVPPQRGKTAIVTGSTSGIGFHAAQALAAAGARVVLAARDRQKGEDAAARIKADAPDGDATFELLDLGSLASIRDFAERIARRTEAIDILVNNAGLMMIPRRRVTDDGFEQQFGTNHLGHFALTALLWPKLRSATAARIVTVSSLAHHSGRLDFDDLNGIRAYRPARAYSQSKLANLVFAIELQRRLEAAGSAAISIAAHPGITKTNLFATGQLTGSSGWWRTLRTRIGDAVFSLIASRADRGALPLIYAAVSDDVRGGGYYGPGALGESRGWPAPARIAGGARDQNTARRLWSASEELTGIRFQID